MRDFTFTSPNRGAIWSMLALTKTQLAEICGLTTRQISHWTSQGYITTSGRNPERYNGDAIDLCILIKQGLNNGIPLKRSVRMAREFIASELAQQPGMAVIQPPALLDIREKLAGAGASINSVLEVVTALVPREPDLEPVADEAATVAAG
jgi:DNA-binding transcriptional MerR regulator